MWPILALSGGLSFVAVVQSTDQWRCNDWPHFRRLDGSWLRRVLRQRKMRSRSVIVIEIRIQESPERAFMEHDHMIQALAPNGTNHLCGVSDREQGCVLAQPEMEKQRFPLV